MLYDLYTIAIQQKETVANAYKCMYLHVASSNSNCHFCVVRFCALFFLSSNRKIMECKSLTCSKELNNNLLFHSLVSFSLSEFFSVNDTESQSTHHKYDLVKAVFRFRYKNNTRKKPMLLWFRVWAGRRQTAANGIKFDRQFSVRLSLMMLRFSGDKKVCE